MHERVRTGARAYDRHPSFDDGAGNGVGRVVVCSGPVEPPVAKHDAFHAAAVDCLMLELRYGFSERPDRRRRIEVERRLLIGQPTLNRSADERDALRDEAASARNLRSLYQVAGSL